jgi:transposase
MPSGKRLSPYERGLVDGHKAQRLKNREIAKKIGRSPNAVSNYLSDPENYGLKNPEGRPSVLSQRGRRYVLREASNKVTVVSRIKEKLNLKCHVQTVQRVLKTAPYLRR